MPWRSSSLQYGKYCCLLFAPIHRKMRYLKVHSNLKRRAECFIVKRTPALRIPQDKQTQMSVFALTVRGAYSLRLARKIAAKARRSTQGVPHSGLPQKKVFAGRGDTCVLSAAAHYCGAAQNAQSIDETRALTQ